MSDSKQHLHDALDTALAALALREREMIDARGRYDAALAAMADAQAAVGKALAALRLGEQT